MNVDQEQLRLLPSVDELLHSANGQQLVQRYSRSMTLQAVRASISQARIHIHQGASCPSSDEILSVAEHILNREPASEFTTCYQCYRCHNQHKPGTFSLEPGSA